ncbi:MAG: hypothetical protein N2043_01440 [Ignavibacterium sp.]|nr:hypothetical protein [Ignavibacterium sp.]
MWKDIVEMIEEIKQDKKEYAKLSLGYLFVFVLFIVGLFLNYIF